MEIARTKTLLNQDKNRFELKLDKDLAIIDLKYSSSGDVYMIHTKVPDAYNGKGVGHKLVRESLAIAEEKGIKVIPLCPFVRDFILTNMDDYKNLISSKAKMQ